MTVLYGLACDLVITIVGIVGKDDENETRQGWA